MLIKLFILLLIKLAELGLSWLPTHTPIAWPGLGVLQLGFSLLALVGEWVHLPVFLAAVGIVLTIEVCLLLYAAWRALLKFIPMFG